MEPLVKKMQALQIKANKEMMAVLTPAQLTKAKQLQAAALQQQQLMMGGGGGGTRRP